MKLKMIALLFLLSLKLSAQQEVFNPTKTWFFGAEAGLNTIASFSRDEGNASMQFGLVSEYYFAKQWSVIGRLKYFKTGVSFATRDDYARFDGAVISIPLSIKWEFRIYKNLRLNIKAGASLNMETKSDYDYPATIDTDFSKTYWNFNEGMGLNYFLSKNMAVYVDIEGFVLGGYKGHENFFYLPIDHYTDNVFYNVGFKYSFRE